MPPPEFQGSNARASPAYPMPTLLELISLACRAPGWVSRLTLETQFGGFQANADTGLIDCAFTVLMPPTLLFPAFSPILTTAFTTRINWDLQGSLQTIVLGVERHFPSAGHFPRPTTARAGTG